MTPDPHSQPDLATENARLRSANAKLVSVCRHAEGRIVNLYKAIGPSANREGGGNGHAENDDVVHMLRAAIAEAEAQP